MEIGVVYFKTKKYDLAATQLQSLLGELKYADTLLQYRLEAFVVPRSIFLIRNCSSVLVYPQR